MDKKILHKGINLDRYITELKNFNSDIYMNDKNLSTIHLTRSVNNPDCQHSEFNFIVASKEFKIAVSNAIKTVVQLELSKIENELDKL